MKRISGLPNFISPQIQLTALSLRECKLVFCLVLRRVNVGRIYSSIAADLKFDWSIQVTLKKRALVNLDSFEHIRWYGSTKANKYSSCYLFLSLSEQVVYFHETDYCIILSHYLQLLAEVLQNRCA